MSFGLACEGATDFAVIESILLGHYGKKVEESDIRRLQPPFDKTSNKQIGQGGWEVLLSYLQSSRFRDDVLNSKVLIISIDSDDSEHPNFNVKHTDTNNRELSIEELIVNIEAKLSSAINQGQPEFYDQNREKIIFCIAVHSIECWLCSIHREKPLTKYKSLNCHHSLERILKQKVNKDYSTYVELSKPFISIKKIQPKIKSDPSLVVFIEKLKEVEIS